MTVQVARSAVEHRFAAEGGLPRLGIIALATDLTTERDAARLIPQDRAASYVSRIAFENPSTPENLAKMGPRLTEAADLILPGLDLAAILYACTAASVTLGDAAVADAIGRARPGVPVVTPPDAAVEGFAALGIRRVGLVTPYLLETTEPMVRYFAARGLDIVTAECMGIADDRDIARVDVDSIVAVATAADRPEAEGIFLSCTALRGVEAVETLEARLGKPVLTSNLASLWRMMHHAGIEPPRKAPGSLFAVRPEDAKP